MSDSLPTLFVVRYRLWRICLRLFLCFQCVLLVVTCVTIVDRARTGQPLLHTGDGEWVLAYSAVLTGLAALIALPLWQSVGVVLSTQGVSRWPPYSPPFYWVRTAVGTLPPLVAPSISWNRIAVVQRKRNWIGAKWLCVVAENGEVVYIPERPADFDGFREAVERFAGPDHPLARAVAAVAEEG